MRREQPATPSLSALGRELRYALDALAEPGAGTRASLECRAADLRQRFLATPARDLPDIEARLVLIAELVASLGEGYLLDLVRGTLGDVRALRSGGGSQRE